MSFIFIIEDVCEDAEFKLYYPDGEVKTETYTVEYEFDSAKTYDDKEIKLRW